MLITSRNIALGLAVAALGLVPAAALATNGADDGAIGPATTTAACATTTPACATTTAAARRQKSDERRVAGTCTARSTAKLKVKSDDGRLETEFEVDQNRNGVSWTVRLRRNGKLVVTTSATTKAPSGSFSVERRLADPAGSDRITARAKSPSGEVCKASLTV